MMGQLPGGQQRLFYSFNLEDHVPAQYLLRSIDQCLDLSDLRAYPAASTAFETAVSWEHAQKTSRGIPVEIAEALDENPDLAGARLLLAIPEHKVKLVGPGKASQTDVWALLRSGSGLVSMAVEGKAGESFASTVGEWLKEASDAKKVRLEYLCRVLQIGHPPALTLRYQLFHRTASALIEAERFGAEHAVMIVQSFQEDPHSWDDFSAFCRVLGASPQLGRVSELPRASGPRLYLGWVSCPVGSDDVVASVV